MLNRNLDIDVDGYVAADFYALADAVDALGGIEIELTDQEAAIMNQSYIHFVEDVVGKKSEEVAGGITDPGWRTDCVLLSDPIYCGRRLQADGASEAGVVQAGRESERNESGENDETDRCGISPYCHKL